MINSFRGEYRFLSNFYPAKIEMDGRIYPSVEHAYQAGKTTDDNLRDIIRTAPTPGLAKRHGSQIKPRPGWELLKLPLMEFLLRQKFYLEQVPEIVSREHINEKLDLRDRLLATHPEMLVEGNTWGDTFWGVCAGEGSNHLGRLLMKIRGELRNA